MNHLVDVYRELYDNDICFFSRSLPFSNNSTAAVSIECGGDYGIFVDTEKLTTVAEETVTIGHEAGHCMTGATHQVYSPADLVQRHENRADKWAIKKLVPENELGKALADGHIELWDLAEYFGVTEDFMRKAVCWYQHGSLAVDLYF